MDGVGGVTVLGRINPRCHCEPHRGVAIQSGTLCGMPGNQAGSPRQDYVLPRNDRV